VHEILRQKFGKGPADGSEDVSSLNADAASRFLQSFQGTTSSPRSDEAIGSTTGGVNMNSASSAKLMVLANLEDDDPNKEKLVLSEIDKFRLRQAQRDN
jgi:hypothetical protein